jgi:hypothetical protein
VSPATQTILCCKCGDESEGKARGWRAYLVYQPLSPREQIVEQVAIYCPACTSEDSGDGA